jgi:hypothetical protein
MGMLLILSHYHHISEIRVFQLEFGSDVAFATPAGGASTAPGILDQQNLALVDTAPR